MVERDINEERREVGGREKKSNNGGEWRGERRGREVKVGERRGRGVKRWHQPQLAVALLSKKRCCYRT